MKTVSVLFAFACLAMPGVTVADTYQLWLEQFDEGTQTTICKYHSGVGEMEVAEFAGRFLCPRVACRVPSANDDALSEDCVPAEFMNST